MNDSILKIENLKVYFPIKAGIMQRTVGHIKAVDGVSIDIKRGETVGLVGESGCGKTTIGRSIVRLNSPTSGQILLNSEKDILKTEGEELRKLRKQIQIIFQDPYSSLNPRHTIKRLLGEVLTVQMGMTKAEALEHTSTILSQVGLSPVYAQRYPHEFSGGQRQRVAIAKAIALKPEFLVCDEAVSALDVSIQSQIINLLMDLKEQYNNMTYLFISHALNVVEYISDRVVVMYLGKIVELADNEELFSHPQHPYTQALLSAIPILAGRKQRERIILKGEVPSASNIPKGCRFHTRCPYAASICSEAEPPLVEKAPNHWVACHL
ncbi:ABC transporter ATP-binding protein [Anaeropeptidivorans aminofermentans]|uniref:ABC transporter ATP-binding protein n=1 Tax=Anaeropeptidivorans aminofermentans TaxID=2934315 RepID=UPI002024EF6B|nr:oligopeptide/dipeptide ABC transporter ATP-binding protein [Anaeropeptidivorans aminofermentans]MBE6011356.1 ATP-binding cassette domain-containing protein [Lachnospiraceae bacterium]